MAIRLVALDLDGTVVPHTGQPSKAVLEAIAQVQAKDIPVVVITGRMYQSALRYHQLLASTLPLASYQGALIKDPHTGAVHRHQPVDPVLAQDLVAFLRSQDVAIHGYFDDTLYVQHPLQPISTEYSQYTGVALNIVPDLSALLVQPPTKILALGEAANMDLLHTLKNRYDPQIVHFTRSTDFFIEAVHPLVHKGQALAYVAEELLGLSAQEVLAIGDHFNDLEMLSYAGVGVAMGTAPLPVQAVADWIAPPVLEDGVRVALERFVL